LVKTVPGARSEEKRIHRSLANYRAHGEWFHASRCVQSFVGVPLVVKRPENPSEGDSSVTPEPALEPTARAVCMVASEPRRCRHRGADPAEQLLLSFADDPIERWNFVVLAGARAVVR
jgi:hypothetical protein